MENVLTLIAGPASALSDAQAARARAALDALGADTVAHAWLSPGRACDIPFALLAPEQAEAAALAALDGAAVDAVAQAAAQRRKLLLAADMDSTVVAEESLDELAAEAGLADAIKPITAQAMNGEIDFAESLARRVALLAGVSSAALDAVAARLTPRPGARRLVATMRAHGAHTILVSSGFRRFTDIVAARCGFDAAVGNALPIDGRGRIAGTLSVPILDGEGKLAALVAAAAERKLPLAWTLAIGDGANDLAMLQAAGLGVAYHAKPAVAARTRTRIDHADLTALLYVQGYRDEDIVEG